MATSEKEITLDNILSHIDEIHAMRLEAKSMKDIAAFLGLTYNVFYKYISIYISTSNYKIYYRDLSLKLVNNKEKEKILEKERDCFTKISRAWDVENERVSMVEDALFKSCFDHTIIYRFYDKKTGSSRIAELPVPASYNAQRYFLINRCANKWSNENKDSIAPITDKISSIKVEWKESEKDEKQQERVDKIEKDL